MAHSPLFRKLVLALQTARRENLKAQDRPEPLPYSAVNWSRRKFMATSMTIGATGLVSSSLLMTNEATALPVSPRIAVIGAGIAGLNAAYQLKKSGYNATVYEARSRIGGRMFSVNTGDGLIVDIGGELINTDHKDMLNLVDELNIDLFNRAEDSASFPFPTDAYYFNGTQIRESQLAVDLRLIAAQMSEDAALLDEDWDTYAPEFDRLSVADYLTLHKDKITKPYLLKLLINTIHTEYGVEPEESSAIQFILLLPAVNGKTVELLSYSDEVYSVVGGSAQITDALGKRLTGQIRLGMKLTGINKKTQKYQLTFANQLSVEADMVIIAIPFPVLATVKLNVPLPTLLNQFIHTAKLGSNEKVIGRFSNRFWRQKRGFTNAAWTDLGFSEVWDATQRQSTRLDGALNFFLGGKQAQQLANTNVSELGKSFVNKLNSFIPGAIQSALGNYIKSSWTQNPLTMGGYTNYQRGQLTRFGGLLWIESDQPDESQQVSAGNIIFAGEHLSDAYYGFMNGAAETGRLAAALAVEKMVKSTKTAG